MPNQPDQPDQPAPGTAPEHAARHRRTRAEERMAEIDITPTALLAQIETLTAERDAALARADEYLAVAQREQAEFANLKRRSAEERDAMLGLADEDLIAQGRLARRRLRPRHRARPGRRPRDTLARGHRRDRPEAASPPRERGRHPDRGARHRRSTPRDHEAIANVPGTGRPEGEIVGEVRRGYRLRDRVLRPSLVAVSDGTAPTH